MNPNLDRLEKIIGLVDQSYVKPEELVTLLEVFKNVIQELKTQLENQITDVESKANTSIKEVAYTLNELELKVKGLINDSQFTSLSQIKELSQRLTSEMSRIEATIPSMPDLSVYEAELEQIRASIPVIKETILDTPKEIRDKLEGLKGDERLDISAIKGVENSQTVLTNDIINRAISIVDQRTSFLINKVSNLQNQVNNILGTSGSGTSSGSRIETPIGAIDDSNTQFTFVNLPTILIINGLSYRQSGGLITWTVSNQTITLSIPVGINGSIFGISGGIFAIEVAPTNDIPETNTSFSSSLQPTYLSISGLTAFPSSILQPWSYSAGVITTTNPVGIGGSIFGIAGVTFKFDSDGLVIDII